MKLSLLTCLILFSPLLARENPFFSVNSSAPKVTSNVPDTVPSLGSVGYTLPDQARILKEVSITYQNADGTIETRTVDINKALDWHKPLVISQSGKSAAAPASMNATSSAQLQFIRLNSSKKELLIASSAPMIRHFALTDPNRIVLDFKYTKLFEKEEKALNAAPYMKVSLSHHGAFARATLTLDGRYGYTLKQSGKNIIITSK